MNTPETEKKWTMRDRVLAVMDNRLPDRLPFIDRIEIWYKGMQARETMPLAYEGMSLDNNRIERVKYIADRIEAHDLAIP